MKMTKKILGFIPLAIGAAFFVACSPEVEDTTANYAEKEKSVTTMESATSHTAKGGSVSYSVDGSSYGGSIATASKDTQIAVKISSYAKLDSESVENAVKFYMLSENPESKYYYPIRDSVLAKTLLHTSEPGSYSYGGTTTFLYNVDTSAVETNKIALFVDATVLKDKSGNAVLNLDKDDESGEETDNYITYIRVSKKANGTDTTSLSFAQTEDFRKQYLSSSIQNADLKDSDGKLTGKIRFTVAAPYFYDYENSKSVYGSEIASSLASIYSLETKALGATTWQKTALSFEYHDEKDETNENATISAHTYTADTAVLPYGTQWRLIRTYITGGSVPSEFAKIYGHAGYFFYCGSKEYSETAESGTSEIYTESPANIYAYGTGTQATFTPISYDDDTATRVQTSLLSVTSPTSVPAKWYVSLNSSTAELSSASDFIVTDSNNKKLDATVTTITGGDNRIISIEIALKNKTRFGSFKLWVGNGTTLKENPEYPTQVKFGVPFDSTKGDVSGYVFLQASGIIIDDSASSDISKYVVTYVNGQDYTDYYYYFESGTYYIQLSNGYTNLTYLTNAGYTPACYYGSITVTSADETSTLLGETYSSSSSSSSFSVSSGGLYKVRVRCEYSSSYVSTSNNINYNEGYVGFHIYK